MRPHWWAIEKQHGTCFTIVPTCWHGTRMALWTSILSRPALWLVALVTQIPDEKPFAVAAVASFHGYCGSTEKERPSRRCWRSQRTSGPKFSCGKRLTAAPCVLLLKKSWLRRNSQREATAMAMRLPFWSIRHRCATPSPLKHRKQTGLRQAIKQSLAEICSD